MDILTSTTFWAERWPPWLSASAPLFKLGGTPISALTLLGAALFVVGVWWLAALLERSVLRLARRRADDFSTYSRVHMLSRLLRYAVWVLGTLIGLNQLGIDLSNVALVGTALAVGLGFGLQNIVSNFVSGIIILVERSLKVGDFVDLESGVRGHVREIAMRYTRIVTNDAVDVLVPNSEFINRRVINWTHDNAYHRMRVPFGVAYGTPKEKVLEAGIAAAKTVPQVLDIAGRQPTVWLVSYGDSAVNYELVVWADRDLTTHPASTHAKLMWALDDELARHHIAIPFPQRDLHVRSGTLDVRINAAQGSGANTLAAQDPPER
ncbi:MAG TPA: mechanosensitive ion channel [Burkholderiaceae bacterium]|nr:mechanosensitive ion channel [Burkholderiaceae bacterium]